VWYVLSRARSSGPAGRAAREDAAHRPLSVLNAGIGGNRVLADGLQPSFGPSGLSRLSVDAIHQAGVRAVIILEGINDIGQAFSGTLTAKQLITGYKRMIKRLHRAHLRVLLGTITPAGGYPLPTYGETADRIRVPVNEWIRSQKRSDGVIDFAKAVRDPSDPSRIRPKYDGSDHLHFSPAGYRALAGAVQLPQLGPGGVNEGIGPR
jgi:lysophospholipase L1-like esterase